MFSKCGNRRGREFALRLPGRKQVLELTFAHVIYELGWRARAEMLLGRPLIMTQTIPERRAMRRFDMRLPAEVRIADGQGAEMTTETDNVSARGVFFHLQRPLQVGEQVAVTLTFPPHVTLTEKVRVRFDARVIRVEPERAPGATVGIAAAIEAYEFLRNYPLEELQESSEPERSR